MIRRPPRSTQSRSSAASDVYKRQIQIHDLNGAGEVLVGQIPDPGGPISKDHSDRGPLPASAPSLRIDAEAKLFGGFDGCYVGSGVRVADGPAFLVHLSLIHI